jgi:hypothetical protein
VGEAALPGRAHLSPADYVVPNSRSAQSAQYTQTSLELSSRNARQPSASSSERDPHSMHSSTNVTCC